MSTVNTAKLTQLKLSPQEKLDTLKRLDEVLELLTEEDKFEDEIKQADSFKKGTLFRHGEDRQIMLDHTHIPTRQSHWIQLALLKHVPTE